MTCAVAREWMLEAERADLAGATASELSAHIAGCAACRHAAREILAAERELEDILAKAAPRLGVEGIPQVAARQTRRRRLAWTAPLAAAAVVAAVLVARRPPLEPPTTLAGPVAAQPAAGFAVEAPPGRTIAVFQTDNPDIVVVWFF